MARSARKLREQAEQYRLIARKITDPRLLDVLATMSEHYDEEAAEMERQGARKERESQIRRRANEIWKERGMPAGRDVEHWHAAEQEMAEVGRSSGKGGRMKRPLGLGFVSPTSLARSEQRGA